MEALNSMLITIMQRMLPKLAISLAVLGAILLSFPKAFADKFNTETSASTRALGMGNAGVNTERGPYAVFYNPANIAAKKTGMNFQLVNFQLDVSEGWLSRGAGGSYNNFMNLSSLYEDLRTNPDTYAGGRFSVFPNFTIRNFSIGMLYEVNQGAEFRAHDNALRVKARNRFAPTAALSFRMFKGILRFGASVQWLTVGNADSAISQPIDTSALNFKRSINSASGFSKTAGMTLTFPFRYLPSFSVVARDIGSTKFSGTGMIQWGDGHSVDDQPMIFDLGSSLTVYMAKRLEMKLSADYRDFVNKLQGGRFRHVFAGAEFTFYDVLSLRAGLAHGYPTFGLGIRTRKASLEFATYADEKDDRLRGSRDQRFVLQYTWGLFK